MQGNLDEELRWIISDILANRNEWWVPGKIVTARSRLANYWKVRGGREEGGEGRLREDGLGA